MAKDKRTVNPATAHLKSQKSRALKKSKAAQATAREERLAHKNPVRLDRRIAELKDTPDLKPREREELAKLERDVVMIRRAREKRGEEEEEEGKTDTRERKGDQRRDREEGGVLGKRRREGEWEDRRPRWEGRRDRLEPESSDSDEEARMIPMPKDVENMPPVPRRRGPGRRPDERGPPDDKGPDAPQGTHALPAKPVVAAPPQTVYEGKAVLRDLRKEATRFVPAAVRGKMAAARGEGRLVEPEEAERLEREGYLRGKRGEKEELVVLGDKSGRRGELEAEEERFEREMREVEGMGGDAEMAVEAAEGEAVARMMVGKAEGRFVDEGRAAERALRHVEIEDVEDEDGGY
ncbi:hypothetical protein P152DRAFT_442965 [Eremomyces bilateralis CBS 781.70]|uniref:Wbp11/ELF5/Saf1 N-terminal domain-containing protein n=1 Tax=Eremomyces bilateralis CBS 781.70 TaxID=1392243 RepID=A0A6G1FSV0_9PEZI|nr:uncharacterized protein P152DRAFT_442965 [Eremomyces bilateralis CBS 781.70]KAF1808833.1 hypothetical protein P152DRAFT_442965 [Eremomyces bilateralis CBS 781.70]